MSKAFTRESDAAPDDEDDDPSLPPLPAGTRNYMTPAGYRRLREELMTLLDVERPKVVEAVSWAPFTPANGFSCIMHTKPYFLAVFFMTCMSNC